MNWHGLKFSSFCRPMNVSVHLLILLMHLQVHFLSANAVKWNNVVQWISDNSMVCFKLYWTNYKKTCLIHHSSVSAEDDAKSSELIAFYLDSLIRFMFLKTVIHQVELILEFCHCQLMVYRVIIFNRKFKLPCNIEMYPG